MAFENVFGNVDFRMPVQAAQNQQNMFMNALGRGIAMAEAAKDRDMRQRQLDMQQQQLDWQLSQPKPVDFEQMAMRGLYNEAQGLPVSEQEMAARQVMGQTAQGKIGLDEYGNPRYIPSPWERMGINRTQGILPEVGASAISEMPMQQMAMSPQQPPMLPQMAASDVGGVGDVMPMQDIQQQANQLFPNDIKTRQEFKKDMAKMAAEEKFKAAKIAREKEKSAPKAEKALFDTFQSLQSLNENIDKAIEDVTPWTAGAGSLLSVIPATPAKDLQSTLKTIQSDSAFGKLQQMRDNSPTGGALGSVSEREIDLLKNAQAALDQDQSPAQLRENLQKYKAVRQNAFKNVLAAYEQDYGSVPEKIKNQFEQTLIGGDKQVRDNVAKQLGLTNAPSRAAIEAELKRRGKL